MQIIDIVFTYVLPLVAGLVLSSYILMYRFLIKNSVKFNMDNSMFSHLFSAYEIPFKYSESYQIKNNKPGPLIKVLVFSIFLFITAWICVLTSLIYNYINWIQHHIPNYFCHFVYSQFRTKQTVFYKTKMKLNNIAQHAAVKGPQKACGL